MLFRNIAILDEDLSVREHVNVVTDGAFISYIGEDVPEGDHGEEISGRHRLLMPAFFNAHAHSPMSLMRGYGENLNLQDWLFTRIFPFEDKLTPNAVYQSTLLTMAESLKYGIVSTSDMYYFVEDMVRAVEESGCKANISRSITNPMGDDPAGLVSMAEAHDVVCRFHGSADGRIRIDASLHAEYTSNEETARAVADYAKQYGIRMHVHVSETKSEQEECKGRHGGRTPVRYLADCGIFDTPSIAAHCVWIEGEDYDILREKGVTVATNPVSNLKLASGICDVKALMDAGVRVAIGTDSVASNNNLSMFEEMKTMALLAKVKHMDPTLITPKQALTMATRNGALAQGREDCGILKVGARADLVMLRTDTPNMQPCHDLLNNIVLSATDSDVAATIADGRVLYKDGEFTTIDVEKTAYEVDLAVKDILSRL